MKDDELRCTECEYGEFTCLNKKCIPQAWVCDRIDDCGDKSDEMNCESQTDNEANPGTTAHCEEFRCFTGKCIPFKKVCDKQPDCYDHSDEDGKCGEFEVLNWKKKLTRIQFNFYRLQELLARLEIHAMGSATKHHQVRFVAAPKAIDCRATEFRAKISTNVKWARVHRLVEMKSDLTPVSVSMDSYFALMDERARQWVRELLIKNINKWL